MGWTRRSILGALLLTGTLLAGPAAQAQQDPKAVISSFYDVLLSSMKEAKQLGYEGRFKRLEPVVKQAYDLPFMMSIAVGPSWSSLNDAQKQKLVDAFSRYSVAQYAGRFDGFSGEKFDVGNTSDNKAGKLVESKLVQSSGEAISLNYQMHEAGGAWKIIDVFLSGTISQLAVNRAEFSGVIKRDGPDGLATLLDRKSADFAKGS
jgi:phospholipid transport system substrate-binding protein